MITNGSFKKFPKYNKTLLVCVGLLFSSLLFFFIRTDNNDSYRRFISFNWFADNASSAYKIISSNHFCYQESNSTIIFIHLTNHSDEWLPLEACAFKSAAIMNNDSGVCVLTMAPMLEHKTLISLPNLDIQLLDITVLIDQTPLAKWYESYVINDTRPKPNLVWEMSDALRFAYLYKFGGRYLDTDMLTLKNFGPLGQNVLAWEDGVNVNGAAMFFEKGHPFLEIALNNFNGHFQPGVWGSVGPTMITALHKSGLVNNRTYEILPRHIFYPTHYTESEFAFSPSQRVKVNELTRNAYTLHLWRAMIKNYWNPTKQFANDSFVQHFLESICA